MSKMRDLTGKKFGKLTVINRVDNKGEKVCWLCKCDCGNETCVTTSNLVTGHIKSCGCGHCKHGYAKNNEKNRLYSIWRHMIERCYREDTNGFSQYGGRGITVCEEWRKDVSLFISWAIENGYKDNLSIDRMDNDKGYSPENCRWVSQSEQCNNKRNNIVIEYKGKKQTLTQWCEDLKVPFNLAQKRYHRGWEVDRIFNEPVKKSETGVRGVSIRKDGKTIKYRAYIYEGNKRKHIGTYDNLEDAVSARRQAEKERG